MNVTELPCIEYWKLATGTNVITVENNPDDTVGAVVGTPVGYSFGNIGGYFVTDTVGAVVGTTVGYTFGNTGGFRESVGVPAGTAVGSGVPGGMYTARMTRELPPPLEASRVTQ